MRSKTVILLALALGCGLVASIGISQVLQRNQDAGPAEETTPIWVAMADIKSGDLLSPQNLKLEQWPKEKVPPGALGKLEDIDGKHSRSAIFQGEAVLEKKLRVSGSSASDTIPTGFRAYTVQGDAMNSHGGLLHPGDRVDVLVFIDQSRGSIETGTKTILQDIKVFAVNDQLTAPDEKLPEAMTAKTVTLLLTPSQVEKATLAAEIGHIRLVIRSPDDKGEVNPAGTRLSDLFTTDKTDRDQENMDPLFGSKAKPSGLAAMLNQIQHAATQNSGQPQPAVEKPQSFTVQIIKGTEITQSEFTRKFDNDSRWENGSAGPPSRSEPAENTAPATTDPSNKSAKGASATKKDGAKSSDDKNDAASAAARG
ncbi:MAG TPA: Flp pilus assembly protein CpaB [Pirellulales bacterium]|jgi:pilus assembly protein CpaB|nr:Flp pilus assembly protein CpaB [Pirellulales bacterium]